MSVTVKIGLQTLNMICQYVSKKSHVMMDIGLNFASGVFDILVIYKLDYYYYY